MFIYNLIKILSIVIVVLLSVAYFTLAERKIMGTIQRRRGPNVVGFQGLMQPLADGLKLFVKESVLPSNANKVLFVIAPMITFGLSLMGWVVIPLGNGLVLADINVGILYLLGISALGVYGIILSGWSSNSKYAFLGALRSAAQMVSYEVSLGFILVCVVLCAGSFNLTSIVLAQQHVWYYLPHFPVFVLFFISALAETNRHPFDLPEAEAELVSGYNVEYSAMGFALFFLGEYANMLLMSALTTILFLGGWLPILNCFPFNCIPGPLWFGLKICFFVILFVVMRACLPRLRYDQLMNLGWKIFLPFSLGWLIFTASILISFNWLPN
uniref:NADH-ubiquinone oxidoreductase chain 1 n=1 Tax=Vischeria sp. CAUP Q 202 TaxID=1805947 RepID=A0A140F2T1_9STRA|nr:NADH dehydrogenase subunit 1 [Vischeria punctata]AML60715.1 NADH dehydrogenase subunit 1 [Vischeria sp. CAUP Q 202]UUA03913.1 NADH dehydrogenase subunit 1 [Vischeria punctata]